MNRLFTRHVATLMIPFLVSSSVAFSQFDNVDFLKSASDDGVKFIEAYITPWQMLLEPG